MAGSKDDRLLAGAGGCALRETSRSSEAKPCDGGTAGGAGSVSEERLLDGLEPVLLCPLTTRVVALEEAAGAGGGSFFEGSGL